MLGKHPALGDIPPSKTIYTNAFAIAWPSVLESVLVGLVSAIDSMMVGTIGPEAIAAVGITTQPRYILLAIILSINIGVTAIVARRKGEGDQVGANDCLRQAILLSGGISLVLTILGYVFARPLMLFAGAQADTVNDAVSYFRIVTLGLFFTSVGLTINAAQRGVGNTKISMKTNTIANVVNIIFNYLLIGGNLGFPRLGVSGAAIATSLGFVVSFCISVRTVVHSDQHFLSLSLSDHWHFDGQTVGSIFKISSSAMVEQLFMRIGFFTYAKIVAGLGTIAFATHQICMNIINLSFTFGDGLSVAASALVGQNLGAKRGDLAILYGKALQRMALICATGLFLVFLFGRHLLIGLFTNDAAIIAEGGFIMIICAVQCYAQTYQVTTSGALRGAGDVAYVAVVSFISIGVLRPIMAYLFCYTFGGGLIGAWFSVLADQYIRMFLFLLRYRSGKWTKIKI